MIKNPLIYDDTSGFWLNTPSFRKQPRISLDCSKVSCCIAGVPLHGTLQTGTDRISRLLQQPQDQSKVKGLAACNSQTASPFGCLNNFYFKILSNFLGSLQDGPVVLLLLFWDLITQRFFRLFSCKIRRISSFVPNTSSWKLLAETRTAPWPRMMSCSRLSLVATRTLRRPRSS